MKPENLIYILVMALTTYLVRAIPMALFRGKLKSRFMKSFFYYIPYAVLSAMTIPAIFTSANGVLASVCGFAVAVLLALFHQSLIVVSVTACIVSYVVALF